MTPLHLAPCRYCHSQVAEAQAYESETMLAITCRACGARGPLRPVLSHDFLDAVAALAARDWNAVNGDEYTITGDGTDLFKNSTLVAKIKGSTDVRSVTITIPPENHAEKSPTEAAEDLQRKVPRGKEMASSPAGDIPGAEATQAPKPSGGAGGAGAGPGRKRHPIGDRLERYLKRSGKGKWSGAFSISDQQIQNIISGKSMPKEPTVATLRRELDELEAALDPEPEIDRPPAEVLPNKFGPATGAGLPKFTPPARCARTP